MFLLSFYFVFMLAPLNCFSSFNISDISSVSLYPLVISFPILLLASPCSPIFPILSLLLHLSLPMSFMFQRFYLILCIFSPSHTFVLLANCFCLLVSFCPDSLCLLSFCLVLHIILFFLSSCPFFSDHSMLLTAWTYLSLPSLSPFVLSQSSYLFLSILLLVVSLLCYLSLYFLLFFYY
jgi:hypothetical protein